MAAKADPFETSRVGRLLEKRDIPPGMHVSISADWAVDNQLTDIAPDGSFEFSNLAPGIYGLSAAITGYTPADDTPRELLVERDRRNVAIHMARSTAGAHLPRP